MEYISLNFDSPSANFKKMVLLQKLIELGATDLLVPGILPIGCFPLYLTLYSTSRKSDYNARTGCLRRYNRLAFHHNRELKQQLDELQKKYPNTKIMYGDYFKAAMQFVVYPGKFGEFSLPVHYHKSFMGNMLSIWPTLYD